MVRSQHIVFLVDEMLSSGYNVLPEALDIQMPVLSTAHRNIGIGIGMAGGAASIANMVWQAKRRKKEQLQQVGMGVEHAQVRQDLNKLRRKKYLQPHSKKTGIDLKQKLVDQNTKVREVEHRGLTKYNAGIGRPPPRPPVSDEPPTRHPS